MRSLSTSGITRGDSIGALDRGPRSSLTFAGSGARVARRRSGHGEETLAPLRRSHGEEKLAPLRRTLDIAGSGGDSMAGGNNPVRRSLGPSLLCKPPPLFQSSLAKAAPSQRPDDDVSSDKRGAQPSLRLDPDMSRASSSPVLQKPSTSVSYAATPVIHGCAANSGCGGDTITSSTAASASNAAKCQAVASLQRFFFEEVARGGDPNAAAATALLRLAEESRPNGAGAAAATLEHDEHRRR